MQYYVHRSIVALLLLSFLGVSCIREFPYNKKEERKLVVNAWVQSDSTITLQFSQSLLFNDPVRDYDQKYSKLDTEKLSLSLLVNGEAVPTHDVAVDSYKAICHKRTDIKVKSGDQIAFTASYPGLKSVSASLTLPPYPTVEPITYKEKKSKVEQNSSFSILNPDGTQIRLKQSHLYREFHFEMPLQDAVGERNFYLLTLSAAPFSTRGGAREPIYQNIRFQSTDVIFAQSSMAIPFLGEKSSTPYLILSDASFNGKGYPLSFFTEILYKVERQMPDGTTDEDYAPYPTEFDVVVNISQITEGAYYFFRSMNALHDSGENPLVEPVRVHTNIKDGLGIFAGVSSREIKITVPVGE